ncbi:MAG TPA: restriction endonuclease [Terracidiphilus sp.]|nr:restriction endonuclease [Terracidiphilus sp.]
MGIPSTQIIALWVQEELADTGWSPLRSVAIAAVRRRWTKPEEAIEEFVDDHLGYIAEVLRNDIADRIIDGKIADIQIDEETPPYIRRIFPRRPTILDKLRRIDPFEFERVCARILQTLGADAATTQRTADGGIDFTATKLKIVHGTLPMPASCHGVVIGQAKRYKEGNAISETKLREFVGASVLKRHRMSTESAIAPLMPTLYAFWTTSDLEPNAKKYARSVGLWYMDGVTLSAYAEELGLTTYIEGLAESILPKTV